MRSEAKPLSDTNAGRRGIPAAKLRVSQIVVNVVLLNEHDAPITPEAIMFSGNENGTAAENLALWLEELPMQLQLAADAQETNGAK